MSACVWDDVTPLLAPHHEVVALTTLRHRGGAPATRRPVRVADLVDDAERALDARGLDRPHVAGNSLGGWVAIELARRGRAASVCALSPAGSWTAGTAEQAAGVRKIRGARRFARVGCALPALMRPGPLRRLGLRHVAEHGERLTPAQALEAARDLVGCAVIGDLLGIADELAPLDPLPCPVTLAWAGADAILPPAVNGRIARARLPAAGYVELAGTGHVPMIDEPRTVAAAILSATRRA